MQGYEFEAAVSDCLNRTDPIEKRECLDVVVGALDSSAHYACYENKGGRNASFAFERLLEWNREAAAVPLPTGIGQQGLLASLQVGAMLFMHPVHLA